MKTGGIFGKGGLSGIEGGGVFGANPVAGLGAVRTGGVFGANPVAGLGAVRTGGVFGANPVAGLGALGTESFSDAKARAKWNGCQDAQAGKPLDIDNAMNFFDSMMASSAQQWDCYQAYREGYAGCTKAGPPAPGPRDVKATTVGGALTDVAEALQAKADADKPADASTRASTTGPTQETGAGKKCTDPKVIAIVQGKIGTTADGKWGPASQTALQKSGRTFKSFVPDCSLNVPSYGGISSGGGGTTSGSTGPGADVPSSGSGLNMAAMTASPVFWTVLLVAGVGGYFYLSGNEKKGR